MHIKESIPLSKYSRLINSGCVVLVSMRLKEKLNIVTIAWHAPVSKNPPLLAICVARSHFSSELITESKEFVVNIPSSELIDEVKLCGSFSGRDRDKFKEAKLNTLDAEKVSAPLIKECIAHIECKVGNIYEIGDHNLFVGEVLSASANPGLFDGEFLLIDKKTAHTVNHLGVNKYIIAKEITSI